MKTANHYIPFLALSLCLHDADGRVANEENVVGRSRRRGPLCDGHVPALRRSSACPIREGHRISLPTRLAQLIVDEEPRLGLVEVE